MPLVSGVCRAASAPMLSHGGSRLNASKPEANPKTSCPKQQTKTLSCKKQKSDVHQILCAPSFFVARPRERNIHAGVEGVQPTLLFLHGLCRRSLSFCEPVSQRDAQLSLFFRDPDCVSKMQRSCVSMCFVVFCMFGRPSTVALTEKELPLGKPFLHFKSNRLSNDRSIPLPRWREVHEKFTRFFFSTAPSPFQIFNESCATGNWLLAGRVKNGPLPKTTMRTGRRGISQNTVAARGGECVCTCTHIAC